MAHLRIENRALPAGPTVIDEIANATFFAGLMLSVPEEYGDVAKRMSFDDAKSNFFRAARHGLDAQFNWFDGHSYPSSLLILDHLLPLARRGLLDANVDSADVNKYQLGFDYSMGDGGTLQDYCPRCKRIIRGLAYANLPTSGEKVFEGSRAEN